MSDVTTLDRINFLSVETAAKTKLAYKQMC
jgi:hypothetical protein